MNVYFVIAGMLLILLSAAHAVWGERRLFNLLDLNDQETEVSLYVPWHQLTFVLAASGVGLLLAANFAELRYLPYFILTIVVGNFAVFIVVCIVKRQTQMFGKTLPQSILFSVLIVLIALGIVN